MKTMRSSKNGICADEACRKTIEVGDPIVYFGPGRAYGLACHRNEKTEKHLMNLLKSEGRNDLATEMERLYASKKAEMTSLPKSVNEVKLNESRPGAQEWVVRIDLSEVKEPSNPVEWNNLWLRWTLQARYGGQLVGELNVLEFRAPRNIGTAMTKTWAERAAKDYGQGAEAAPLYVEGGTK